MNRHDKEQLRQRRVLLENPFAHLEQLTELEASARSVVDSVHASRRLLQNPYAYLDENGQFTAANTAVRPPQKRTFGDIEKLAISIQRRLWAKRTDLWGGNAPASPIDVLDPAKAAHLLGYRLKYENSLGVYAFGSEEIAVAGVLDREQAEIRISLGFPVATQRFTSAHEIGHLVLHPQMTALHRDRAVDGGKVARDRLELEADKFAAYFMLPAKLVRQEFQARFLTNAFQLSEDATFALGKLKPDADLRTRRSISRFLATAIQYNGKTFRSLSETFRATAETVAIRLEELDLVIRR